MDRIAAYLYRIFNFPAILYIFFRVLMQLLALYSQQQYDISGVIQIQTKGQKPLDLDAKKITYVPVPSK